MITLKDIRGIFNQLRKILAMLDKIYHAMGLDKEEQYGTSYTGQSEKGQASVYQHRKKDEENQRQPEAVARRHPSVKENHHGISGIRSER